MARKRKKVSQKAKQERQQAKAKKFKELASKRGLAAVGRIRLLRNLANRNQYSYTEAEVKKLINVLRAEVDAVEAAFASPSKSQETTSIFN